VAALVGPVLVASPGAAQSPGINLAEPGPGESSPRPSLTESGQAHPVGAYAGVSPGTGNTPPRAPAAASGGAILMTWPGFQGRPDGASRFFVQTNGHVVYESRNEQGRFVLLLKNTSLHLRNNRRPLETRYFNTPVTRARVERRGRDLAVILDLRGAVTPTVTANGGAGGYQFLLLEFPPGNYLPEELRAQVRAAETQSGGGSGYTVIETDMERPPPVDTGSP